MKAGRPKSGTEKPTVRTISVALDEDTDKSLRQLERAWGEGVRRGRVALAVRRAIGEAAARLKR
jgi:hypothetical protein